MGLPPSPQVKEELKEEVKHEVDGEAAKVNEDSRCASCRAQYEQLKDIMKAGHGAKEELSLIR